MPCEARHPRNAQTLRPHLLRVKTVVTAVVVLAAVTAIGLVVRLTVDGERDRAAQAATRVAALCEPIACRVVRLERVREGVWRTRVVEDHPEGDHVSCIVLPLDELRRTARGGITGWKDVRCGA